MILINKIELVGDRKNPAGSSALVGDGVELLNDR